MILMCRMNNVKKRFIHSRNSGASLFLNWHRAGAVTRRRGRLRYVAQPSSAASSGGVLAPCSKTEMFPSNSHFGLRAHKIPLPIIPLPLFSGCLVATLPRWEISKQSEAGSKRKQSFPTAPRARRRWRLTFWLGSVASPLEYRPQSQSVVSRKWVR